MNLPPEYACKFYEGVIDLHGGMDYSYTLPACDEDGAKRDITFGTSRELKEGAFIRLTVMPVRGVLEWSEQDAAGEGTDGTVLKGADG